MTHSITMSKKVEEYLKYRRRLGYLLKVEGGLLEQFGAFADATGHRGALTIELALKWARLPEGSDRLYQARRLEIVRCFARHLSVSEPATQIPPRGMLGPAHRRNTPHIFSESQLVALMAAAGQLRPTGGLRPHTYVTLIGLLASTGLRISEALRLNRADANLRDETLTIRETKFRKTRLVPLHPSAAEALRAYDGTRNRVIGKTEDVSFFLSDQGRKLPYSTVRVTFRKLCDSLQINVNGRRRPRLHDLRHTFACRRIESWYDTNVDLYHAVSSLSVYLGHAKVSDTYWYLTATPSLLACAAKRFELFIETTSREVNP